MSSPVQELAGFTSNSTYDRNVKVFEEPLP
jgi:hypothetical protein